MADSTVTINLNARYDPKPFKDATDDVKDFKRAAEGLPGGGGRGGSLFRPDRAASNGLLNLTRQTSDVFTQGLSGTSPFTILIQQGPQIADVLLSGALSAGKFAGALAGLGVGVAGVMGAVTAYKEMSQAIDEATESQERLNKSRNFIQRDIAGGMGVAPGQGPEALAKLAESFQELESERNKILFEEAPFIARLKNEAPGSAFVGTPFGRKRETAETVLNESQEFKNRLSQIDLQMSLISKAFTRVRTGISEMEGGKRLFSQNVSPGALSMMRQREIKEEAKTTTLDEIEKRRMRIDSLAESAKKLEGKEKADLVNTIFDLTTNLDLLSKAVEERIGEEEARANKELDLFFDGAFNSKVESVSKTAAMTAEAVSARQRIGGMANAPIFSNFQKQTDLLRQIATQTQLTAQNTARQAQTVSPIGAPMGWNEFQASRITN